MAVVRVDFGGLVFSVVNHFGRLQRLFCKRSGLYAGQPRVLTILREHEGCTLKELAIACDIGMPSLSVSVRNMEKSGLVRREGGARSPRLYLTESGREKAGAFHLLIDRFYEEFLASVSEEEGEQLERLLRRFNAFMDEFIERAGKAGG